MDDPAQNAPGPFRFADSRQERIFRRLLLIGPGPAAFYRDACRLLGGGPVLDSTTHLVAHLLRDIESAIRDVLIPHNYTPPAEKRGQFKAEIDAILKTYGIAGDDPVAIAWRGLPDRADERWLGRLAHRSALAAPRRLDEEFRKFHGEVERILDVVLGRFEGGFTTSFKLLDVLIAKTDPTREDAKTVRGKIPNNLVSLNYFFGKIESPGWLDLLAREGFFQRPPEPVRDDAKSETRFPPWPESRYLARMAAKPELQTSVVDIALAVPETQNVNVHNDIMMIALTVPAPLSARLAPRLSHALRQPYQLGMAHRVGDLVSHLARGGEGAAALQLTGEFLTVLPDPDVQEVVVEGQTRRLRPHPRTPYSEWVLQRFLKDTLDGVVDAAGIAAVALVCKALDDAVRLSRSRPEEEGPEDYSRIWRPAIDQRQEDRGHDLKSTLVTAVRQAGERLIQREPTLLPDLIQVLEAHQWAVFQRIALHILREAPASALPLVEERLGRRERFCDRNQKREYMLLAQTWLPTLRPETQSSIMQWIDEGPELDGYQRVRTEMAGTPPTEAELAEYADRRRLEDLRALREVLPVGWRERYQALIEKYGEPEMPDFLAFRMGSVTRGPGSPIAAAELRPMPVPDLIDRLKCWKPAGEFLGPSPEGLGRELSGVVADEPARFAEEAEGFKEVDPTYVRGLITGLRDAVNKDRPFGWVPVLRLCQWVVEQPVEPGDGDTWERDRGWRFTRKAIADLLEDGFRLTPAQVPFELRQEAWDVLCAPG